MLTKDRQRRKRRNKDKVKGTADYPRLVVFRSNKFIYGQIIDDLNKKVIAAVSEKELKTAKGTKTERATLVGKELAERAKKNKISKVRFDRAGYRYHGRVKAVADGAREGGLEL